MHSSLQMLRPPARKLGFKIRPFAEYHNFFFKIGDDKKFRKQKMFERIFEINFHEESIAY